MGDEKNVVLSVRKAGKTYRTIKGSEINALDSVTFDVREEEFVVIIGPSGCGKTTLLNAIAGLLPLTKGEVFCKGYRVECGKSHVKDKSVPIGLVFQTPVLLPWRNILDNTLLSIEVLRLDRNEHISKAKDLLKLVGLEGFEDKYPQELSGGMQQRASIVRALVAEPPLLLMDEPFSALDAMTRDDLNLELLKIWSKMKKTILYVTHNISEAVFLGDKVLVMSSRPGRIVGNLEINLPRPRKLEVRYTKEFTDYCLDAVNTLKSVGVKAG